MRNIGLKIYFYHKQQTMVTKKQLAALTYGRAVRANNLQQNRKTTNGRYKCKKTKRKTKGGFDAVLDTLEQYGGETETIMIDGQPVEVPIREPKKKIDWNKVGKFMLGAAGVAAGAGLGYLGYKGYKGIKNLDIPSKIRRINNKINDTVNHVKEVIKYGEANEQIETIKTNLETNPELVKEKDITRAMNQMELEASQKGDYDILVKPILKVCLSQKLFLQSKESGTPEKIKESAQSLLKCIEDIQKAFNEFMK